MQKVKMEPKYLRKEKGGSFMSFLELTSYFYPYFHKMFASQKKSYTI
jgi:hypothetical protein